VSYNNKNWLAAISSSHLSENFIISERILRKYENRSEKISCAGGIEHKMTTFFLRASINLKKYIKVNIFQRNN
jgi:hypothetical protein